MCSSIIPASSRQSAIVSGFRSMIQQSDWYFLILIICSLYFPFGVFVSLMYVLSPSLIHVFVPLLIQDLFQTTPLEVDDFNAICDLLVLWNQLSNALNTISKQHATLLFMSGIDSNGIGATDPAEAAPVSEEEPLIEAQDPSAHVTAVHSGDLDWSSCMTGWSALQTISKDLSHEKLKSKLRHEV